MVGPPVAWISLVAACDFQSDGFDVDTGLAGILKDHFAINDPFLPLKVSDSDGFGGGSLEVGMAGFLTPTVMLMRRCCSEDVVASALGDANNSLFLSSI